MNCKEECMELKKDGTLKDCPIVKENEQLKAQIEKMKCCRNCKYKDIKINKEPCSSCKYCCASDSKIDKWELAE